MARSLAGVKVVASMISSQVSGAACKSIEKMRGFASGVDGSRKNVMAKKPTEKEPAAPWIPDPVTGYYRPEKVSNEIDVAELREVLLLKQSKKNKKN